jgi:dihydroflavonol-4-reductase
MRVFVLGATGFIGGQIARQAHQAGFDVHALRRQPGAVGSVGDLPISWHSGDLAHFPSLAEAFQGADVLFHAAGYAPQAERNVRRALRTGVEQMRTVLAAARQAEVRRVVYTSSLSTIGPPPPGSDRLADERDPYLPGSTWNNYYEVKWLMEMEAVKAAHQGLPVVILCPTAVFGPGDVKPSTSQVLLELARGRLPVAVDVDTNFVDGRDVALAHVRAAEQGEPGERYILGGHNMNTAEALQTAARLIGVREPRPAISRRTAAALLKVADGLRLPIPATMRALPYWQPYNAEKGWLAFGFTPRPYSDTVCDTVGWFREHGYLGRRGQKDS